MILTDKLMGIKGIVVKVIPYDVLNPMDVLRQKTRIDGAKNSPRKIAIQTDGGEIITSYSPRVTREIDGQTHLFYKEYKVGDAFPGQ